MKKLTLLLIVFLFSYQLSAQPGGYALKFDGTNGFVSATLNTGSVYTKMTLEFWFSPNEMNRQQFLADLHSNPSDRRRVIPYLGSDNILMVYIAPNTGTDIGNVTLNSGITTEVNAWHHLAIVINGTHASLYIDGKMVAETIMSAVYGLTGDESLYLAIDKWLDPSKYGNIKMDEVRVWNTDRSEAQIVANMFKELTGSESGLIAYYKMSDGSGTVITDNTGHGYTGSLVNGPAWVASGCFAGPRQCLDFDGTQNCLSIDSDPLLDLTTNYTLEAWIYPHIFNAFGGIISKYHDIGSNGYTLRLSGNGSNQGINFDELETADNLLTANKWFHIAAVKNGSTRKLYINGIEQTLNGTPLNVQVNTDPVAIGADFVLVTPRQFDGMIDEVRIWNIARTEDQVREYMSKNLTGDESGLVVYYRFDENTGTIAHTETSNNLNATMVDMGAMAWSPSTAFNTWIGGESSSWNNTSNWSRATVPSGESVGIYNWTIGNKPTISGSPTLGTLYLQGGVTMPITSNFTINGNLFANSNLSIPANATPSVVSGNMVIANGTTTTLEPGAKLTVSGKLTNNAGEDGFIIKSDVTGSGSLLENTASVNAKVERYLTGSTSESETDLWHLVSPPVSNAQSAVFMNDFLISYDEPTDHFSYITQTNLPLNPMQGYEVWAWVDGGKTDVFSGTINTGSQSASLTRTNSNGWNLLGNPYPCAIDFDASSGWTLGNAENTVYIWNTSGSFKGQWAAHIKGGTDVNGGSRYIPAQQGFFLHCTTGTTVSMTDAVKVHSTQGYYKNSSSGQTENVLRLQASGNNYNTETVVMFNPDATAVYDSFDALYRSGALNSPQLYSIINPNTNVCINAQPFIEQNMMVPLGFSVGLTGYYSLVANNLGSFDNAIAISRACCGRFYGHSDEMCSYPCHRSQWIFRYAGND